VTYITEEHSLYEENNKYTKLDSFWKGRKIFNIPFNIIHNIYTDLNEIAMRVKKNLHDVIANKKHEGQTKSKQYLIIFTQTEDLYVLDAATGDTLLEK
jgi:hypothetical protein